MYLTGMIFTALYCYKELLSVKLKHTPIIRVDIEMIRQIGRLYLSTKILHCNLKLQL